MPCSSNSTCVNTNGSFFCGCNSGFSGDGFICEGKYCLPIYLVINFGSLQLKSVETACPPSSSA